MINVAELIEDPDFCQTELIPITRTTVTVVNHRPSKTQTTVYVAGIITISNENTDELNEQSNRESEAINVFTYDRLKTTGIDKIDGNSYLSDIVTFKGEKYIVRRCLDDSQYGFCRSYAVKLEQDEQ